MAVEAFKVLFNQQTAGLGLDGLSKEYTKAEAEEFGRGLKEKVVIKGPVEVAKLVEVEAETADQAVTAVQMALLSKFGGQPRSNFVAVKAAGYVEEPPQ